MAVHIIIDGSNVSLCCPRDLKPRILHYVHHTVNHGREHGRASAVVRSQLALHGDRIWDIDDVMGLAAIGYADISIPLTEKRLRCKKCSGEYQQAIEKSVDARIVMQLYRAANIAADGDTIALVSGDADFLPMVLDIQATYEVHMEVWSFAGGLSRQYGGQPHISVHTLDQTTDSAPR